MQTAVLAAASAIGLFISVYFSAVYYGLVKYDSGIVPSFCRMDDRTCMRVVHHRHARILGLPNAVVGMIYYVAVLVITISPAPAAEAVLRYVSWLSVLFGIFLSYSLFFVIRAACILCLVSHLLNLIIALTLTIRS